MNSLKILLLTIPILIGVTLSAISDPQLPEKFLQLDNTDCPANFHKESKGVKQLETDRNDLIEYCLPGASVCANMDYNTKDCFECANRFLYHLVLSDENLMVCQYQWWALTILGTVCLVILLIIGYIIWHLSYIKAEIKQELAKLDEGIEQDGEGLKNEGFDTKKEEEIEEKKKQ